MHFSAFKISEEWLIVKGGSNQKRSPRLGDRFICMLQHDKVGVLHMFYAILPEREQQEWLGQLDMSYDDQIASVGGNEYDDYY